MSHAHPTLFLTLLYFPQENSFMIMFLSDIKTLALNIASLLSCGLDSYKQVKASISECKQVTIKSKMPTDVTSVICKVLDAWMSGCIE